MSKDRPQITIAGAGAIGCFVGGLLAAAGHNVAFLGRPRILEDLRTYGLHLTDFTGLSARVTPATLTDDPAILAQADLVLVTVKSGATADMAQLIAAHARPEARILSLQNGIENAKTLRAALPDRDIRAGMVPFNVVPKAPGHWHRATSGDIVIEAGRGALAQTLTVPHLPFTESDRIEAIQWGKLLLNLTNAVNALSGQPLLTMLRDRQWRRLMADQMAEALTTLKAAHIPVQSTAPVPMHWVPKILRLPTPLYTRVAAQTIIIDPDARTSMAYDLMAGRKTEVDQLQGVILALAQQHHVPTPITAAIARAIHRAEADGVTSVTPDDIRRL